MNENWELAELWTLLSWFNTGKLKESEKNDKYQDFARDLKKLWNVRVTVILIIIDALGTVTKGFVQGLKDLEIRRRAALLRSVRRLWRILKT